MKIFDKKASWNTFRNMTFKAMGENLQYNEIYFMLQYFQSKQRNQGHDISEGFVCS